MNYPAIVASFAIALGISLFNGVYPFSLPLFFGLFAVWAILCHLKGGPFSKQIKPKEDESTDKASE